MSRRKPLAALAAVTAAVAVAVPTASASAATTAPIVFGPGSLYCEVLHSELMAAGDSGNIVMADYLGEVFVYSGCGGAAI
jgi:hypothetical protein